MSTGLGTDLPPVEVAEDEDDDEEIGWKEGLFVRDLDGRLIRYDKPTQKELETTVTLTIDDKVIEVRKAVPATDEMGHPIYVDGMVHPRATTIYDAVSELYERLAAKQSAEDAGTADGPGKVAGTGERGSTQPPGEAAAASAAAPPTAEFKRMAGDLVNPIPILCHMKYMEPVGVCRVCVVQIGRLKRSTGKFQVDEKLLPACQHRVEDGMIVHTIGSANVEARTRIETAVKSLVSLLMTDHPTPCAKEKQIPGDCELEALAKRFGVETTPFDRRPEELPKDDSSLAIAVDHNACILCDRCIRGCNIIKENKVLGRMGKGFDARIAFDLGVSMGGSTCVACGECMVSCPTGALTFKDTIAADWFEEETPGGSSRSHRRRWRLVDWLTFGLLRRQTRFMRYSQTDSSSKYERVAP